MASTLSRRTRRDPRTEPRCALVLATYPDRSSGCCHAKSSGPTPRSAVSMGGVRWRRSRDVPSGSRKRTALSSAAELVEPSVRRSGRRGDSRLRNHADVVFGDGSPPGSSAGDLHGGGSSAVANEAHIEARGAVSEWKAAGTRCSRPALVATRVDIGEHTMRVSGVPRASSPGCGIEHPHVGRTIPAHESTAVGAVRREGPRDEGPGSPGRRTESRGRRDEERAPTRGGVPIAYADAVDRWSHPGFAGVAPRQRRLQARDDTVRCVRAPPHRRRISRAGVGVDRGRRVPSASRERTHVAALEGVTCPPWFAPRRYTINQQPAAYRVLRVS